MRIFNRSILETNLSLKIVSLIFGATFWFIFSANHTGTLSIDIPFSFYGTREHAEVKAPETIRIEVAGKHRDLAALDTNNIAVHLNIDELMVGDNIVELTPENLFLPSSVKLVHCAPLNPIITLIEKEQINS